MKGKLAVLALVSAGALATPAVAPAAPPDRVYLPTEDHSFPAGQVCDFPLQITELTNNARITSFSDGRVRLTGAYKVRIADADNGRSIVLNVSGRGWLDRNDVQGASLFYLFPGDLGGPGIYLFHGHLRFALDDEGNIVSLTYTGHRSGNLCEAIA
jgi:hypothetical protein